MDRHLEHTVKSLSQAMVEAGHNCYEDDSTEQVWDLMPFSGK